MVPLDLGSLISLIAVSTIRDPQGVDLHVHDSRKA